MFTDIVSRLTVTNNIIRDNGNEQDSHGISLEVGTNSYIAADVQSNTFGGNVLSDFNTDSFVTAGNPENSFNFSGIGSYDFVYLDDTAQLDLRFNGNDGDQIDVDAIGALYTNNDPGKQNPGNGLNGNRTGPAYTRGFSATNRRADLFRIDNAQALNEPNNDFNQFGIQQDIRFGETGFTTNGYIEVSASDPLFPRFGFLQLRTLSVSNAVVNPEGDAGTQQALFTVFLSQPSDQTVTVDYLTADGTARSATDYTTATGSLTFAPGETIKTVTVDVLGDLDFEGVEHFQLRLRNAVGAILVRDEGSGVIIDDDPRPTVSISDAGSIIEGDSGTTLVPFTVSLTAASHEVITVNYATYDVTTQSGQDYVPMLETLTFLPGQTSIDVFVEVIGELSNEIDEEFNVNLSEAKNADIFDGSGIAIILNDDPVPTFTVENLTLNPTISADPQEVELTVRLSAASGKTVTVDYASAAGSLEDESGAGDFQSVAGTLIFAAGETEKTITVSMAGTTVDDFGEKFFMNFSTPTNALLPDNQSEATVSGDTVEVLGTANSDTIEFGAGTANHSINLNGVQYTLDAATFQKFLIDGCSGADEIRVTGTTENETAQMQGRISSFSGTQFFVDVINSERTLFFSGGGNDEATIIDTSLDDRFTGKPQYVILSNADSLNFAKGFSKVTAISENGGDDLATFFDSTGDDTFVGKTNYAFLKGNGFNNITRGFLRVVATAKLGGIDRASLYDSNGDDVFEASPETASMKGSGVHLVTKGFETTKGFSTRGGFDVAKFSDSAEDDTFIARPDYAVLKNPNYYILASRFEQVTATSSSGGFDQASLYDSDGDDTFVGKANYALLKGDGFNNQTIGFSRVIASATTGGIDRASLYDSDGDDIFNASPESASMKGSGTHLIANNFEIMKGYSLRGGFDVANFTDSVGDDTFIARPDYSVLKGANFFIFASQFDQVLAVSGNGGDDQATFYDSAGNDTFLWKPEYSFLKGNGFLNFARGFAQVTAIANQGGIDNASFRNLRSIDTFFGRNQIASVRSSGRDDRISGFDIVSARPETGQLPHVDVSNLDYIFQQLGVWAP